MPSMAKDTKFIKLHKKTLILGIIGVFIILIPPLIVTGFIVGYYQRIYPQVFVSNTNIGGLTMTEAKEILRSTYTLPTTLSITISSSAGKKVVSVSSESIGAQINYEESVKNAYDVGRSGNVVNDFQKVVRTIQAQSKLLLSISVDENLFNAKVTALSQEVGTPPSNPHFVLKNANITIVNGTPGDELPIDYAKQNIVEALRTQKDTVNLNTRIKDTSLTDAEQQLASERGNSMIDKSIVVTLDTNTIQTLKIDKLLPFLNPQGGYNETALRDFAAATSKESDREVSEPVFNFDGKRVSEFSPGENGVQVNQELLYQRIVLSLSSLEQTKDAQVTIQIPFDKTTPQTTVANANDLGIKELIGQGTSRFSGSIPSRVYNVALASSRINGVLVAPGETFSFASAIGDISKYTGYKEAYIIQGGKTILGDGGGVCQVSTTLFRAVMNAGLPIVERHAHAYRVGYYEQDAGPGLDATVFVPSVDFKFSNDTGKYLLIQTTVDTKKLTADFKIYGTSDGRKATTTKPVVTDQIAPPDDLYVDDPTLPTGKISQIEHKAWGARVSFSYSVERDGVEIYQKNFVSVYQPWRAVFMRGVGPS